MYVDKPIKSDGESSTLAEFVLPVKITPLNYAITNDFLSSLSEQETDILNDLSAGYNMKEISKRNHPEQSLRTSLRQSFQQKAVAYL